MNQYGCFNRKPITTFGATTCQYTLSEIGKVDKKCEGCDEKESVLIKQYAYSLFGGPGSGPSTGRTIHYEDGKGNKWSDCA